MDEVKKSVGVIYLIINLVNGKMYVGQTTRTLDERLAEHRSTKKTTAIANAFRKYGNENFLSTILEDCYSLEQLNEREKFYIAVLKTIAPSGYNLTTGGNEGIPSIETRENQSKSARERFSNPQEREKISKKLTGRKDSNEVKLRKSTAQKKRYKEHPELHKIQSEGGKKRFSNPNERKQQSQKMKKYKFEHPVTEKTKLKISKTKNKYKKRVRCIETKEIFESVSFTAERFDTEPTQISRVCRGVRKIYHGYHFEFVDKNE